MSDMVETILNSTLTSPTTSTTTFQPLLNFSHNYYMEYFNNNEFHNSNSIYFNSNFLNFSSNNSDIKNSTSPRRLIPTWYETGRVQIPLYSIILLLAVIGNTLVILTLIQNQRMRTITNVFLLNLAVSDLLLGVLCMPFTLVGTLLRNFVFGELMCKLLPYLQGMYPFLHYNKFIFPSVICVIYYVCNLHLAYSYEKAIIVLRIDISTCFLVCLLLILKRRFDEKVTCHFQAS